MTKKKVAKLVALTDYASRETEMEAALEKIQRTVAETEAYNAETKKTHKKHQGAHSKTGERDNREVSTAVIKAVKEYRDVKKLHTSALAKLKKHVHEKHGKTFPTIEKLTVGGKNRINTQTLANLKHQIREHKVQFSPDKSLSTRMNEAKGGEAPTAAPTAAPKKTPEAPELKEETYEFDDDVDPAAKERAVKKLQEGHSIPKNYTRPEQQ